MITINEKNYELRENYKDAFDLEKVKELMTDYFDNFDYIVGDWAYSKLRLKGFCNKNNHNFKEINDVSKIDEYIKKSCSFNCSYFILEKLD